MQNNANGEIPPFHVSVGPQSSTSSSLMPISMGWLMVVDIAKNLKRATYALIMERWFHKGYWLSDIIIYNLVPNMLGPLSSVLSYASSWLSIASECWGHVCKVVQETHESSKVLVAKTGVATVTKPLEFEQIYCSPQHCHDSYEKKWRAFLKQNCQRS